MQRFWILLAVSQAVLCLVPEALAQGPWPPPSSPAPSEVVWRSTYSSIRPQRGVARFFQRLAGAGSSAGHSAFGLPVGVDLDSRNVVVVDTTLHRVVVSDHDGGNGRTLRLPEAFQPSAAMLDGKVDEVLVGSARDGTIVRCPLRGSSCALLVPPGTLSRCGGIERLEDGNLLVSDVGSSRLVLFDARGNLLRTLGQRGTQLGEFNYPTAIALSGDGSIWVLDSLNFRVQHLDKDLRPLSAFGEPGHGSGQFALPKGLGVTPDGNLLVSDGRFDRLQLFDPSGRLLLVIGQPGQGPGEFWNLAGVSVADDGTIAVADSGNGRIQLLSYRKR